MPGGQYDTGQLSPTEDTMTHTELRYLAHEVTKAAAAAIEYSDLNVTRESCEYHTAHLVAVFMKEIADYLAENTPTEPTE